MKAAINNAVGLHRLSNLFSDFRTHGARNANPSVERELLDLELIDKIFKMGAASGDLDDAMLPPLAFMSTRRIGILPFLRGTDFDDKHGVDIVRVNVILFDKAKTLPHSNLPWEASCYTVGAISLPRSIVVEPVTPRG